jgi:hypothetical protein
VPPVVNKTRCSVLHDAAFSCVPPAFPIVTHARKRVCLLNFHNQLIFQPALSFGCQANQLDAPCSDVIRLQLTMQPSGHGRCQPPREVLALGRVQTCPSSTFLVLIVLPSFRFVPRCGMFATSSNSASTGPLCVYALGGNEKKNPVPRTLPGTCASCSILLC